MCTYCVFSSESYSGNQQNWDFIWGIYNELIHYVISHFISPSIALPLSFPHSSLPHYLLHGYYSLSSSLSLPSPYLSRSSLSPLSNFFLSVLSPFSHLSPLSLSLTLILLLPRVQQTTRYEWLKTIPIQFKEEASISMIPTGISSASLSPILAGTGDLLLSPLEYGKTSSKYRPYHLNTECSHTSQQITKWILHII